MFSRREGRCCITATRRSSNAPLNRPAISFAASSHNSGVSPANYPQIPPRRPFLFCNCIEKKPLANFSGRVVILGRLNQPLFLTDDEGAHFINLCLESVDFRKC